MNTDTAWPLIEAAALEQGANATAVAKWRQRGVPHKYRKQVADTIEVLIWRAFNEPPAKGNGKP